MLLYLSTNTRPDITFAVSQVACFSANPKQSHATAVKTIVQYLKGTQDKGSIIKPTKQMNLDLYVDADFCGLHNVEHPRDPSSARSRSGHIVMLANCPLVWKSQLQTHISLSTLEAEYSALSNALKVLIPFKRHVSELAEALETDGVLLSTIRARAFEDNAGALILAKDQRLTARTKYVLVKWHWFWSITLQPSDFELHNESAKQRADYFTKPLPLQAFEHNRFVVQGW